MPRQSVIWVTSDTHFNHPAITTEAFCSRPLDYNERIIRQLQHYVREQDTLIHLGDVIFRRPNELKSMLDSVKCRAKFLTMGNHDKKSKNWYCNNGFDGAFESIQIDDILLSHHPKRSFPDGVRINIHGHFHNTNHRLHEPEYNDWLDAKRHRLLAIENTMYAPVNLAKFSQ